MTVVVYDGPPGSGKTTQICEEAPLLPGRTAICVYTREAAATVLLRAPTLTAGTIYNLTWSMVKASGAGHGYRAVVKAAATHTKRPVRNDFDMALQEYVRLAPSSKTAQEADAHARILHAWDGTGSPPIPPEQIARGSATQYLLPLIRWFVAGRPGIAEHGGFDTVIVDEAQDMGAFEMACALTLVSPGGTLRCYGDPGQALYMEAKGAADSVLPAAWQLGGDAHRRLLTGGHRCGDPLATIASRLLRPIWNRPAASFAAPHRTEVLEWMPHSHPVGMRKGSLVLSYSRKNAEEYISNQGLQDVALVPSLRSKGRFTVCTGHAAKGAQAEDVYVLPWSKRALRRLDEQEPGAVRLLYTMLTRAKSRVFLPYTLLSRLGL